MKVPLRGLSHVSYKSLIYTLKTWKVSFNISEKIAFLVIAFLIALTSWRWSEAAGQMKNWVPKTGGTFTEGVVASSLDSVDLGRLTKAGLVRFDQKQKIVPDLALSWEISEDKSVYKFNLVGSVSAYDVLDVFSKNPTYVPNTAVEVTADNIVTLKLDEPNSDFLEELTRPIFPYGPYKVAKKNDKEIKLEINPSYHLSKPYVERIIVRLYKDSEALQKAADKGKISGALDLKELPKNWQEKKLKLEKKHVLFINSSKSYLKRTSVREKILNGERPDGIETLDVLEVNGEVEDQNYVEYKKKLEKAGLKLNIRKVELKDAVQEDLPKRNYDLLYILVDQSPIDDPYSFYNSTQRSANGQNFAEVANADLDEYTKKYSSSLAGDERNKLQEEISKLVDEEKIAKEFDNIEKIYRVSNKLKGFELCASCFSSFDRFDLIDQWYFYSKRQK
jgi:ABC-type transport system substrate-binding protein